MSAAPIFCILPSVSKHLADCILQTINRTNLTPVVKIFPVFIKQRQKYAVEFIKLKQTRKMIICLAPVKFFIHIVLYPPIIIYFYKYRLFTTSTLKSVGNSSAFSFMCNHPKPSIISSPLFSIPCNISLSKYFNYGIIILK